MKLCILFARATSKIKKSIYVQFRARRRLRYAAQPLEREDSTTFMVAKVSFDLTLAERARGGRHESSESAVAAPPGDSESDGLLVGLPDCVSKESHGARQ